MGITMQSLEGIHALGLLQPKAKVLDIGSSNLYSATEESLKRFIGNFRGDIRQDGLSDFIPRIIRGSAYTDNGGINQSFVGELLERVGMEYLALDVANGYRTKIFDLNRDALDTELQGRFDAVLNFGTTEHVLNQINAFAVIHDATKPGGCMIHNLPSDGFLDHGYLRYTPQFFLDLAERNDYEVLSFEFTGPSPGRKLYAILDDAAAVHPVLKRAVAAAGPLKAHTTTDIGLMVVLRKTRPAAFRAPLELRTSVGNIAIDRPEDAVSSSPASVRKLYLTAGLLMAAALRRTPDAAGRAIQRLCRRIVGA